MKESFGINMHATVSIFDADTNELIRKKTNTIHPRNMSRILARALANEPNAYIKRIAFGNGATFTDAADNTVYRDPNDGRDSGWESRLYNETYSEIVDDEDVNVGTDAGSADAFNVRTGGGSLPADDSSSPTVTSEEAGDRSNVTITMFINRNEPAGQLAAAISVPTLNDAERCFAFDEIGLYSPGKQAIPTYGYTAVDLGGKNSNDTLPLTPGDTYDINVTVNGVSRSGSYTVALSGSGTLGEVTIGDFCEGFNSGSWLTSGTDLSDYLIAYITDYSDGLYPSIIGKQSYGYLIFQSLLSGATSSVVGGCSVLSISNFFARITSSDCSKVNIFSGVGDTAGVANDIIVPENERERLLTHFIMDPVLKSSDRSLRIVYSITITTANGLDPNYSVSYV